MIKDGLAFAVHGDKDDYTIGRVLENGGSWIPSPYIYSGVHAGPPGVNEFGARLHKIANKHRLIETDSAYVYSYLRSYT